jgi:2-aminophenol/2-amino-5-chlorophenol 1,6-dioxygenase alpha subunit
MTHPIVSAHIVPGHPHILLAPERSPGWASLRRSYEALAQEIARTEADLLLLYSTQWVSVIGHLFQADPKPKWLHVDQNWHELGEIPYELRVDADFGHAYAAEAKAAGLHTNTVNYRGFPVDTGTIVALKLLNPGNRLPAAVVSCNMYAEKLDSVLLGQSGARALAKSGKRAIAVCVTALSNRYEVTEIDPKHDHFSSPKDDEWNRKVLELLGEGRLEDVSQVAREFAHQANADAKFKGIWWLAGLVGQHNRFRGKVHDYQPVWGTGAALVSLTPADTEAAAKETEEVSDQELTASVSETVPARSGAPRDEAIHAQNAPKPVGAYAHARRHGDLLFLAGVGPRSPTDNSIPGNEYDSQGNVIAYDVERQTRAVIDNVRRILEASGSTFDRIIDVTVYLTDMKRDFPAFNRIYEESFRDIQATRTTVEVRALPTPIAVEFKVIARTE